MATPGCIKNIEDNHTGFGPCTDPYCREISFAVGKHCAQADPPLNPDDPVGPQLDPNLNGPGKAGYCYCCCSCFGAETPIEVRPGEYALASEIETRETILTTGADLIWKPRTVESASTWRSPEGRVSSMYLLSYSWDDGGEEDVRQVIVSPDHPFLMEDGTLVAIQDLTKEDLKLRRADGGLSEVVVVAQGSLSSGVSTIQMEGEFDGWDLTGHLLNTNGLVSADYKVQVYYSSQHLDAALVHTFSDEQETMPVGTPEYDDAFPSAAYAEFVNDPSQWPPGFVPTRRRMIEVPLTAARYLTDAQADDVRWNAPKRSAGNTYPARSLLYLFRLSRGLYPQVDFLLDWDNRVPNAYTWDEWGRRTVVVTGGLVRLDEMGRDGLSIVLSAMLAYQSPDVGCVGEADYAGVSFGMHDLWEGNLFVTVVDSGMPQIERLFSYITPAHAAPSRRDPCREPGIECRLHCLQSALSMFAVPDCAKRRPAYFEVRDARATSETSVQITFSRALDVPTAQTLENYAFDPRTEVLSAEVSEDQPNIVALDVADLVPATTYFVHVTSVVSYDDVPLDPHHSSGAFTTD